MGEWNPNIRSPPTGEVYNGWEESLDSSNNVNLSHSGQDYTPWISSEQFNGDYDMMALTIGIPKSQLDFNQNGQFDAKTESIYKTTETVPNAFTGYNELGSGINESGIAYDVVPEPGVGALLMLGALGALAGKRLFGKK